MRSHRKLCYIPIANLPILFSRVIEVKKFSQKVFHYKVLSVQRGGGGGGHNVYSSKADHFVQCAREGGGAEGTSSTKNLSYIYAKATTPQQQTNAHIGVIMRVCINLANYLVLTTVKKKGLPQESYCAHRAVGLISPSV